MTIDRWSSFLAVRVVPAAQSRLRRTILLCGARTVVDGRCHSFRASLPAGAGDCDTGPSFDPVRLHAIARALASAAGNADRPASDPRPSWSPNTHPTRKPCRIHARRSPQSTPTATCLPENLLRFYIYFSAPMSRGEAYRRIKLLDDRDGQARSIRHFLSWTKNSGPPTARVSRSCSTRVESSAGSRPREELGPVLEAGKSYSLVIDRRLARRDGESAQGRVSQDRSGFGPPDDLFARPKDLDDPLRPRPTRAIPWKFASPNRWTGRSSIA